MMDIVFVHGWGFHPGIWKDVAAQLGHTPHYIDLGFIGGFRGAETKIPDGAVIVGHSLGVMWAIRNVPAPRALISIGGFDCFSAHVPERALRAMNTNLKRDPISQMRDFWSASGTRDFCAEGDLNVEKLSEGLEWLRTWDESGKVHCPVTALAARDDAIVPPAMSESIWKGCDLRWSEDGGHSLPLTRAQWCAQQIAEVVDAL